METAAIYTITVKLTVQIESNMANGETSRTLLLMFSITSTILMLSYQRKVFGFIQGNFSFNKIQYFEGFMKSADHQPTDPPTTYHLPNEQTTTYPPTYVKIEDQILNIYCILQFLKTLILISLKTLIPICFLLLLNK